MDDGRMFVVVFVKNKIKWWCELFLVYGKEEEWLDLWGMMDEGSVVDCCVKREEGGVDFA